MEFSDYLNTVNTAGLWKTWNEAQSSNQSNGAGVSNSASLRNMDAYLRWNGGDALNASHLYLDEALVHGDQKAYSSYLYTLHFRDDLTWSEIVDEHYRWNNRLGLGDPPARGTPPTMQTGRKIRVGFISPCFRNHIQGLMVAPIIENLAREEFAVFSYYTHPEVDSWTNRSRRASDHWRHLKSPSIEGLYQALVDDELDIAIDLNLHMERSSVSVLSWKPARINAVWLGYPSVSGIPGVVSLWDSLLDTDHPSSRRGLESKCVLNGGFWYFNASESDIEVPTGAAKDGPSVFGCLNNPSKLSDAVLRLWSKLLVLRPEAQLALLMPKDAMAQKLLEDRAREAGIDWARVIQHEYQSRDAYLEAYSCIDVALDTFPYNGHMTTLDALWMGVPVVSLIGRTPVGRAGRSILTRLGLGHLAVSSDEEYIQMACSLMDSRERPEVFSSMIREKMVTLPMGNPVLYSATLATALRELAGRKV